MNLIYEIKNELNIKEILVNKYGFSNRFIAKLKNVKKLFIIEKSNIKKLSKINNLEYKELIANLLFKQISINYRFNEKDILLINLYYEYVNDNIISRKMKLDIEDEFMLIIKKPGNMPVHPKMRNFEDTLSNEVKYYHEKHNKKYQISPVNRLDKDTSGIIIFAKYAFIQENLQMIKMNLKNII